MSVAPRAFVSRYRGGLITAPGIGCVAAPLIFIPGVAITRSVIAGLVIVALTLMVSMLVASYMRRNKPALTLSEEGVRLDSLPTIAWGDVMSVRRDPDRPRAGALMMRLRRPLADVLPRPSMQPLGPAPVWRPAAPDVILIRADLLEDPVEDTEGAFRYFLGR